MPTRVFLTVDVELMWRHHAAGLTLAEVIARSFDPAEVGVGWQLARLAAHGLKASFFVDPMPAAVYGLAPFVALVAAIRAAGQEVQLHLHPDWIGAADHDRARRSLADLAAYSAPAQRALIGEARALLIAAGAPRPIAFRAGSYAANDETLAALAALGFAYDSSHNGAAYPQPSAVGLGPRQIAPVARHGVIEVPVGGIEDRAGRLRHLQLCALSVAEMRAALDHAVAKRHVAVTIVSHSFELANRAGTRANRVHLARFERLCALLAARRDVLPTTHFADRVPLALGRDDRPLAPSLLRRRWRQAEQLWSNWVEERAA